MNLTECLFCLKNIVPFSELRDVELGLVAQVIESHTFAPNQTIAAAGTILTRLYIVIDGAIYKEDGSPLPTILGTASLLFDYPVMQDLVTHPTQETRCLILKKGHFFTMVNECPSFLVGFFSQIKKERSYTCSLEEWGNC